MNSQTTLIAATALFAFFLLAFFHVSDKHSKQIAEQRFMMENGFYLK